MIVRVSIAICVVLGIFVGYVYFTGGAGLPALLAEKLTFIPTRSIVAPESPQNSLAAVEVPLLSENATEQLKTVGERTGELSSTVGKVLGEAVQVSTTSGEQSLQERAFDYGRYLYCQQVVKDYEARTKN
jgi:hypothetical protein